MGEVSERLGFTDSLKRILEHSGNHFKGRS